MRRAQVVNCTSSAALELSPASRVHVVLDRLTRFEHGEGATAAVMPARFQMPSTGQIHGLGLSEAPGAARARVIAETATDWIEQSVSVISSGPDKFALRQLLFTLGLALGSAFLGCVIFTGMARVGSRLGAASIGLSSGYHKGIGILPCGGIDRYRW